MLWVSEQNENDKRLRCCSSTCNSSPITFIISISPKKISATVLPSHLTMPSASSQKQIPLRHCVVSSLPHSKVQNSSSSMYDDEPIFQTTHHQQQQPQSLPPLQVATSLWPQQTSNYWFPNWRELFHGFIVVPSSQPRHATVSNFAQNQAAPCSQYSPSSCTQYLHLGTDDPPQSAHHGARSAQNQQITTSPFPSSSAHTPLSRFDDVTRLPRPSGKESHTAAQSPTPVDQAPKRDEHIACPPSSQVLGPLTKYTIKSPFWLPQGWVTEMRMRSTGTAADKFYKHLASGRRFRSRNEVLHFISTGKGRTRKQGRRKKSLNLSLMNNFAQKKHTAFAASKPVPSQSLPSSSSENRRPLHVGNPLLTEPRAELSPNGETVPPSKQHICFSANSGIQGPESLQLQPKRPAQDETQKLPVTKKQKTLPLIKTGEDNQASMLWQWFKRPDTEAKASEMAEQRIENDLSSKDTASQKTEQLGREIQAAHKTVVQMSKEMQATVEKLSREIREAQKDVELGSDLKLARVPAEMQVALTYKADAGKICRDTQATPRECMMSAGNIVQASQGLPIATINQTGQPESTVGFVSHNVQKQDNIKGFPEPEGPRLNVSPQATNFVLNPLTAERSFVTDSMSQAIQPAIWPQIASHQVAHMDYGSHAGKRLVDISKQATQPAETAFVTSVNGIQAARSHAAAPIHVTETTVGDVTLSTLWPGFSALNVAQSTQIASIAHAKEAEKCGFGESHLARCAEIAHFESSSKIQTPQRHVDMSGRQAKQPAQVDRAGIASVAQAVRTQIAATGPLLPTTERPVYSIGNADALLHNPAVANTSCNVVPQQAVDGSSEQWHVAQVSVSCEMGSSEEVGRQKYQDRKERSDRRNKFAAVLNPKLDLSRLNPDLTARQKAKVVQRMKTRHARELLATLGLHLCRKAIR